MTKEEHMEKFDREYSDKELIKRFIRYLTSYKSQMVLITLTILALSGISIVPPLMVQRAYDILELNGTWLDVAPFVIAYVGLSLLL